MLWVGWTIQKELASNWNYSDGATVCGNTTVKYWSEVMVFGSLVVVAGAFIVLLFFAANEPVPGACWTVTRKNSSLLYWSTNLSYSRLLYIIFVFQTRIQRGPTLVLVAVNRLLNWRALRTVKEWRQVQYNVQVQDRSCQPREILE